MEHQKYPEYEAKDAETDLRQLTVALQEHHPQHHAQRVQVELLRRAVPREAPLVVAHPHTSQHHGQQAHHLRRSHQPRKCGPAGAWRRIVHFSARK